MIRTSSHKTGFAALLAIAALFALLTAGPAQARSKADHKADECAGSENIPAEDSLRSAENSTLCLLNNERGQRGLRKLKASRKLDQAADYQSSDMIRNNYFDHQRRGGPDLLKRVKRTGYFKGARIWSVGENIAWGTGEYATPESLVRAWMHSAGHKANILDPDFRDVGIGIAIGAPADDWGSDDAATATTDFGKRF